MTFVTNDILKEATHSWLTRYFVPDIDFLFKQPQMNGLSVDVAKVLPQKRDDWRGLQTMKFTISTRIAAYQLNIELGAGNLVIRSSQNWIGGTALPIYSIMFMC